MIGQGSRHRAAARSPASASLGGDNAQNEARRVPGGRPQGPAHEPGRGGQRRPFPGTAWVKVPGVQLDSAFEMTQETRDGIPLRFKGQAVYRVVRPERAAALFDFSTDDGLATVDSLVKQCCLAELRDLVPRMTLGECIEQRKTTLTGAVRGALERLVGQPEEGWGIAVEVVQVAQVYIVDAKPLRLDAETRGQIQARSECAALQAEEEVKLARIVSARKIQEEAIETDREAVIEEERLHRTTELEKRKSPGVPGGGSHRPGGGESRSSS